MSKIEKGHAARVWGPLRLWSECVTVRERLADGRLRVRTAGGQLRVVAPAKVFWKGYGDD